ncbi:hypothetical protein HYR69_03670 [Candidatus Sumerlaeota bacterium]|nr:hypothetical protein [Candidatus Sumerlaeota bacterium]MBI3736707.1 hypothetical protein [Candidatus Sumerlaeota bacterium]
MDKRPSSSKNKTWIGIGSICAAFLLAGLAYRLAFVPGGRIATKAESESVPKKPSKNGMNHKILPASSNAASTKTEVAPSTTTMQSAHAQPTTSKDDHLSTPTASSAASADYPFVEAKNIAPEVLARLDRFLNKEPEVINSRIVRLDPLKMTCGKKFADLQQGDPLILNLSDKDIYHLTVASNFKHGFGGREIMTHPVGDEDYFVALSVDKNGQFFNVAFRGFEVNWLYYDNYFQIHQNDPVELRKKEIKTIKSLTGDSIDVPGPSELPPSLIHNQNRSSSN